MCQRIKIWRSNVYHLEQLLMINMCFLCLQRDVLSKWFERSGRPRLVDLLWKLTKPHLRSVLRNGYCKRDLTPFGEAGYVSPNRCNLLVHSSEGELC